MLLTLDLQSDVPIYQQIKTQIIEGIATGRLEPGEPLPSVRQLARDLGINMHTVNKAYNYLKQDEFILVHRQKGVVVNPGDGPGLTEDYLSLLSSELRPLAAEAYCRGMRKEQFLDIVTELYTHLEKPEGEPS